MDKFVLKIWIGKKVSYFVGILSEVRDIFLQLFSSFFLIKYKVIDIFKPHQNLIKKGEYNNPDEFGIQSPNPSQVQRQRPLLTNAIGS